MNPESCTYSQKTISRAQFIIKTLDTYCSQQGFLFWLFPHLFPFIVSKIKFTYVSALFLYILPIGRTGFFFITLAFFCPEVSKSFIKETSVLLCPFEQMCWCIYFSQKNWHIFLRKSPNLREEICILVVSELKRLNLLIIM